MRFCFDFDFNILTAFIRLGRARPAGAGCPPYLLLLLLFDFYFKFSNAFSVFSKLTKIP